MAMNVAPIGARIDSGSTRDVYEHQSDPSLVVKIGRYECYEQNKQEVQRWQAFHEADRKYFCPIVEWADDFSWIAMVKVEKTGQDLRLYRRDGNEQLMKSYVALQMKAHSLAIFDIFDGNVGLLDGELVIIDYAA